MKIEHVDASADGRALSLGQPWNAKVEPGFRPAEVQVRWDRDALIVQADLRDDDLRTLATGDNQRMWQLGDVFEMFIQVEGRRDYAELHVTPGGHRLHMKYPDVGGKMASGRVLAYEEMLVSPVGFTATAARTPDGWRVDARVPARVLGLDEFQSGQELRLSFSRYDASAEGDPVLSTTAAHPIVAFHRPDEWTRVRLE